MAAFDGNNCALYIENTDVDLLSLRNLKTAAWAANRGPIRINSNGQTVTINLLDIQNIEPLTGGTILNTMSNASLAIVVNIIKPYLKNAKTVTNISGTPATTVKFYENGGLSTQNGNGTTTAFTIAHGLVSSPAANSIRITPGHADSRGNINVSADATNITVTYPVPPPTGTNNVVLFWSAEAG